MNGNSRGVEITEEKVTFAADTSHADRFLPRISVSKSRTGSGRSPSLEKSFRAFEAADMSRVLDFDNLPDPPHDATMRFAEDGGMEGLKFPVRHVRIRGGFLFFFDIEDIDEHDGGHFVSYHAPPLGVVPLDQVDVALPPGGRRVFREHAHTDARNGYEMVLIHAPDDDDIDGETTRPACFLVAQSLVEREKWVNALRLRVDVSGDTRLRPDMSVRHADSMGDSPSPRRSSATDDTNIRSAGRHQARNRRASGKALKDDLVDEGEERDVELATKEFGVVGFTEEEWMDTFFSEYSDFQASARIDELEQWQVSIKKGLRGAVLEQYEYFVEASNEMTTMGKEVASLKSTVETQNELIKEMKEIDFSSAFAVGDADSLASDDDGMLEPGRLGASGRKARRRMITQDQSDDQSDASSLSSSEEVSRKNKIFGEDVEILNDVIEIPTWLDDVSEEISAFIKECRYTDATDLLFKAKTEINDILNLHNQPTTGNKLTKKQHAQMNTILRSLDALGERMSNRLVESLRRKNEALRQAGKRERADPQYLLAPMVSPCCLQDDLIPLQLLVRLGQTQEAAVAYAARRSLLLLESLHERPISGTGNVDLVIYAAQLSQSFFSCLATSVEGFLDLFQFQSEFISSPTHASSNGSDPSIEDSASILTAGTRNVPSSALAAIVLWCDSELSKFSSAFGGTRILGNLALSPPPRSEVKSNRPSVVSFEKASNTSSKERLNAIEVASQCVNQAFQYASENLDSIGLPLTPRLAEYIRSRLKGCEAEVVRLLDPKWKQVAFDWELELDQSMENAGEIPMGK